MLLDQRGNGLAASGRHRWRDCQPQGLSNPRNPRGLGGRIASEATSAGCKS